MCALRHSYSREGALHRRAGNLHRKLDGAVPFDDLITHGQALLAYAGICCGDEGGQLVEGQSFLCMSLSIGTVNQVARQLMIPSLFFYDWKSPSVVRRAVPCSELPP